MDDVSDTCRVWWDDEAGVARAVWSKGAVCKIDEARNADAAVAALGRGPVLTLVDMRQMASIDRAAREFFARTRTLSAVALLTGSPATRMMANVAIGVRRQVNPTKMFTVESEALAWLQLQR